MPTLKITKPKKIKKLTISELLYDLDGDFLRDIILNIVQTNPELEDRIRIAVTPKNQINNPVSYYKKQIVGIPARINDKAKAKLAMEIINKIDLTGKEFENGKNHYEAAKVYQAILDTLLPKTKVFEQKDIEKVVAQTCRNWARAVSGITQAQNQYTALEYLLKASEDKTFISTNSVAFYDPKTKTRVQPTSLSSYYFDFFAYCCQGLTNYALLEDVMEFIAKQTSHKVQYIISVLYILLNQKKDKEFLELTSANIGNDKVMVAVRDYYFANSEFGNGLDSIYKYLDRAQYGFDFKGGEVVKIANEFLKLADKYPSDVNQNQLQQVLVWLTCVGNDQWAYDVSSTAKWWEYYLTLQTRFPATWSSNYAQIMDRLANNRQYNQLLSICKFENDVSMTAKYFTANKYDVDTAFTIARITLALTPVKSLEIFKSYFRYRDYYSYRGFYDDIITDLDRLKQYLPSEKLTDLNNLKTKVTNSKGQYSSFGW
jgi:hypothetical protein